MASVEVNPAGDEVQLYELPGIDAAPIGVLVFRQMALLAPATAEVREFTVTFTTFEIAAAVQSVMVVTLARRLNQVVLLKIPGEYAAELLFTISMKPLVSFVVDNCHL